MQKIDCPWANVLSDFDSGMTPKELAEKYNVKVDTLRKNLKMLGREPSKQLKKRRDAAVKLSATEMAQLYKRGTSAKQIARLAGIQISKVQNILVDKGIPLRTPSERTSSYRCNAHYFDIIDTQEKAYWLGFIYADGNIERDGTGLTIGLQRRDQATLEAFKRALDSTHPIKPVAETRSSKIYISNSSIYNALRKHGVLPNKSHEQFELPLSVPKDLLRHFIRGFFDGDGSVYGVNGGRQAAAQFTSNETLLISIQKVLAQRDIKSFLHDVPHCATVKDLTISRKDMLKFYTYLYDGTTICMERKRAKFIQNSETIKTTTLDTHLEYFGYDFVKEVPGWFSTSTLTNAINNIKDAATTSMLQNNSIHINSPIGNNLRKHFFPQLFAARNKNACSMQEAFKDPEKLKKAYSNREKQGYQIKDVRMAVRGMRFAGLGSIPSFFSPILAKWFYEQCALDGETVYDFATGWGDRYLGAALCSKNLSYVGCDSSREQIESLERMAEFIEPTHRPMLKHIKSELYTPPIHDIAFSCPPYYDTELYSEMDLYSSFDEWLERYWLATVNNTLPRCRRLFCYVVSNELAASMRPLVVWPVDREINIVRSKAGKKAKPELLVIHKRPS